MLDKQTQKKIHQRLRPLYFASFFQGFIFWYAIEKLFMHKIGIDDAGIAAVIVILTIVMTLANLPFGVLADRWSRRGVLVIGTLFLIVATLIDGSSNGFAMYLLGSCLWGFYYACSTGTYDSIIYDLLLEETGHANDFEHYYGKVKLYDGIALVVSSLATGVLVHFVSIRGAYFLTVPFSIFALVGLWRFREPQLHKAHEKTLITNHIKAVLAAVLRRREIMWLTLSLVLIIMISRITLEFDQLWLIALALPIALFGPVNALFLAGYGASGLTANALKSGRYSTVVLGLIMFVASIGMLFHVLTLTIVAIFLLIACGTALEVIMNRWLHDKLPASIRAGASSAVITIGYGVFLPFGLLLGAISHKYSIFQASWILVGLSAVLVLSVIATVASLAPAAKSKTFHPKAH